MSTPKQSTKPQGGKECNHTKCPEGYLDWHSWAKKMADEGYRQAKCPVCGFFTLWVVPPLKATKENAR